VTEEVKAPRRRLPIVVAAVAVLAVGAIVLVAVLTGGDDSPPKGSIGTSPTTGVSTTASPNTSVVPGTTPTTLTTLTTGATSATPSPTVTPATVPASEADFPNPASPPTTDAEWEAACGQLRALLQYADDADLRAAGVSLGCL
jgi:hypothetical protein